MLTTPFQLAGNQHAQFLFGGNFTSPSGQVVISSATAILSPGTVAGSLDPAPVQPVDSGFSPDQTLMTP